MPNNISNRFGCNRGPAKWVAFGTLFSPLESFAVLHGKPAMIAEWASVENPTLPGAKAAWITDAAQTLETWPQVKASMYFDNGGQPGCDFSLGSSPSALQAFAAMGAQPFFTPRPRAVLESSTTGGAAPLDVTFDGTSSFDLLRPLQSWQLDFGDGSPPVSGSGAPPSSVDHVYTSGTFSAELTVSDGSGQQDMAPVVVHACPPPTVTTGWSTESDPTTVTLFASVIPNDLPTTVRFDWGTTTAFGQSSPPTAIGAGSSALRVPQLVAGLQPGTRYYWHVRGDQRDSRHRREHQELHDHRIPTRRGRHHLVGDVHVGVPAERVRHAPPTRHPVVLPVRSDGPSTARSARPRQGTPGAGWTPFRCRRW